MPDAGLEEVQVRELVGTVPVDGRRPDREGRRRGAPAASVTAICPRVVALRGRLGSTLLEGGAAVAGRRHGSDDDQQPP
jgi:hypothetical protein